MSDFQLLPDLALRLYGGAVVAASDEFFAERENLIKPESPVFQAHTFAHKGQVYDGWETGRRRGPAGALPDAVDHDWAIVRLGLPGVIRGVVVDTAYFTGNYPETCAVEACWADGYPAPDELADWMEIVPRSPLRGDQTHAFPVSVERRFTHMRLKIYPDGGVARLRVHGEVVPDPGLLAGMTCDLAALELGGTVVDCSDMFYSRPSNLLAPGPAQTMGDGWETRRRRGSGNDWVLVRLAAPGLVRLAELDTTHFIGNAPGAAALSGVGPAGEEVELLPRTRLQPDTRHRFRIAPAEPVGQVRLDVYPDGGMARLRLFGELTADGLGALHQRRAETA